MWLKQATQEHTWKAMSASSTLQVTFWSSHLMELGYSKLSLGIQWELLFDHSDMWEVRTDTYLGNIRESPGEELFVSS